MECIEVVKAIAEVGVLVVCAAMVITIFWLNYKRNNDKEDKKDDKLDEIMKRVQEQNDLLVKEIISGITGHTLSNEENSMLTQVEDKINEYLKIVQQETNATRVCLIRYHNGNRGMDGLSFLKMSMTNEYVKIGIKPIMSEFQNYFRSFLPHWTYELNKFGKCYIDDIEDIKETDANSYEYFTARGVEAKYGIAIKNSIGHAIGFICLEFLNKNDVDKKQVEKSLIDKQIKIETLLNLKPEN